LTFAARAVPIADDSGNLSGAHGDPTSPQSAGSRQRANAVASDCHALGPSASLRSTSQPEPWPCRRW